MTRGVVVLLSLLSLSGLAAAQAPPVPEVVSDKATYAVDIRRLSAAPVIDGKLDDAVWREAAVLDGFVQSNPDEGKATQRTEVRVGYDSHNLYFGVRCYDSEPDKIISPVADLTVRTDFAEAEADQEAINLTRYKIDYPEKRQFFLEGANLFYFGDRITPFDPPQPFRLFNSRQIGPLETIFQAVHPGGATLPLQVMFLMMNLPHHTVEVPGLTFSALHAERVIEEMDTALVEVGLNDEETPEGLTASISYNGFLFDEATVTGFLDRTLRLLEGVVADPGRPLWAYDLMTAGERGQLLAWGAAPPAADADLVHRLFEERAAASPEAPAVLSAGDAGGRGLTYGELERRANQLAHHLRGFDTSAEEIYPVLTSGAALVAAAVVTAREEAPGDRRLAAYVVPRNGTQPDAAVLRAFVAASLPDYMVPAAYVVLAALPLTPSGKVDRRALPAPGRSAAGEREHVAPETLAEETVAGIWCKVLGIDHVGVTDNFFALGGHSLLLPQVMHQLRLAFQLEIPLRALFDEPTVEGLALAVEEILLADVGQQMDDGPLHP